MLARCEIDGEKGPGYALIKITGFTSEENRKFIIRRMKDGKFLGPGGWRTEKTMLSAERTTILPNGIEFAVGPEIVDELSFSSDYQIEIPGAFTAPLEFSNMSQSGIVGGQGEVITPPILPGTVFNLQNDIPLNGVRYENV